MFAPWLAGATIAVFNYARFDAAALLDVVRDLEVTTFCAPPTVWRMLVQQDLSAWHDQSYARSSAPASRSTPR